MALRLCFAQTGTQLEDTFGLSLRSVMVLMRLGHTQLGNGTFPIFWTLDLVLPHRHPRSEDYESRW